jgi:hypothetical protein
MILPCPTKARITILAEIWAYSEGRLGSGGGTLESNVIINGTSFRQTPQNANKDNTKKTINFNQIIDLSTGVASIEINTQGSSDGVNTGRNAADRANPIKVIKATLTPLAQ